MPTSKTGKSGSRKESNYKLSDDIVESKSICLPKKYWKKLKKEAGRNSVNKYASIVLQNHFTEEIVKKVAFVYDVESYNLLAVVFGTETEVSEYWQSHYDPNSTLYTFKPSVNFGDIKVIEAAQPAENAPKEA
ncbi:MAG: hypothetical protein IJU40_08655 [Desulfovibrionaceae bacterium]|nr:hypothetical protein [Desulfovibrionaceae bacterium]